MVNHHLEWFQNAIEPHVKPTGTVAVIKSMKKPKQREDAISLCSFEGHFRQNFTDKQETSSFIKKIKDEVKIECDKLKREAVGGFNSYCCKITEYKIEKYVKTFRSNSASVYDGLSGAHIKFAMSSNLPAILCNMFAVCLKYEIIPEKFNYEILVPVLKKTTLINPSIRSSYRPITVSSVLSELLEMFILDQCQDYQPSRAKFGFVQGRRTSMATVLAHDVGCPLCCPRIFCVLFKPGCRSRF